MEEGERRLYETDWEEDVKDPQTVRIEELESALLKERKKNWELTKENTTLKEQILGEKEYQFSNGLSWRDSTS